MPARVPKKIVDREMAEKIRALVRMKKARVIKEHDDRGPVYRVYSASGPIIGTIGDKYKYLFEALIVEQGAGDGLFKDQSQSTVL